MVKGLSQNDPVQKSFNLKFLLKDKIKLLVFGLLFFGLFLLAIGTGIFLLRGLTPDEDIEIISSEQGDPLNSKIVVHVDGAVIEPGVYELSGDSRVADLVSKAGGLSSDADSTQINLAAKLADGQKIYLPRIGENIRGVTNTQGDQNDISSGSINVNTASESLLDTLPGVGPVTAQKIIAGRPYSSSEELLSKKAVGRATFEKIKGLVTVY